MRRGYMAAKVFDGKRAASEILELVSKRVKKLSFRPKLVSFYNPRDPGSALYTRIKKQKAESVGIEFVGWEIYGVTEAVREIGDVGGDEGVTGILVQHPTGEHAYSESDWKALVEAIPQEKDVDGLRGDSPFVPATVKAIFVALSAAGIEPAGLKVSVVGATGMVGRPLVRLLNEKGAKVREIDENTRDVWFQLKNSDVVISAVGKSNLIHGDQLKQGVVVIDVGSPGGDVDFDSARAVASFITPVPGGIGPLTVVCLLENVVEAAEKKNP
ncbi:MAG: hypothetical protein A3H88_01380 [Candidatus Blackburnbacteria bacterium RIFCSPLOWO2_02_FULL_44_9]|nr:MAG: hypothetical protein A3H88_01380 [Candidatus Blackburnbacteria bacterium RIFCSPLOWO2_02_FULL_44_9]